MTDGELSRAGQSDPENDTSATRLTDAHHDWVREFCGVDPRDYASEPLVSVLPVFGVTPEQNPHGGNSLVRASVGLATGKLNDALQAAPGDNSIGARFIKVFEKVGEKFGPDVVSKLKSLNVVELIAFAAVFIVIEDTPIGWAAMLVGAALIGKELVDVIEDVSAFISITSNPNGDLDAAASHLSDALARLSIDTLIIFLTHKASGAVKSYAKPPAGFVDALTPEGFIIRVPSDKVPENVLMSKRSGNGEEFSPRRQPMSDLNKSSLDVWVRLLNIDKDYRRAFGEYLKRIHRTGEIWEIIGRTRTNASEGHPHIDKMSVVEKLNLKTDFEATKPSKDEGTR